MESGEVRSQFQELQLHQQQKLMERMKSRNQSKSIVSQTPTSSSLSFGLGDDLNLNIGDVSSSSIEGLHSALEDANTRMREEIRELKDETGRLRKQLAEKDYEIRRLHKAVEKKEEDKKLLASAGVVSDSAAVKIVDLSKRNRELTAEVEVEKTKSLKLLKRIAELERKGSDQVKTSPRKKTSPRDSLALHPEAPIENVEELQDKLQSANIKMAEYRNQIQELKQEMKIAQKMLHQEIGEPPASMQVLLNSGGTGFRGRMQQITALQDKCRDLEQKLVAATGRGNVARPDKNLERIRSMEKQRKEQAEELRYEIAKANDINSDLQKKFDAAKARNKVLLSETRSLKSQIAVLTEKGSHDNELIMTLMRQHENLQRIVAQNVNAKENSQRAEITLSHQVNSKQQQEQAEITRLRHLLAERDARLRRLEQSIEELKAENTSQSTSQPSYNLVSVENQDNRDMQQSNDVRVELTKYQALYNSANLEHQKLTEVMNSLSKRVEELTMSSQDLNGALGDEKRKSAKLESLLESLKPNKPDAMGKDVPSYIPPEARLSELETMLSIQRDENAALKESLESTLQAKQEDVTLFHEVMEQTKTVFMDALKSLSSRNQ